MQDDPQAQPGKPGQPSDPPVPPVPPTAQVPQAPPPDPTPWSAPTETFAPPPAAPPYDAPPPAPSPYAAPTETFAPPPPGPFQPAPEAGPQYGQQPQYNAPTYGQQPPYNAPAYGQQQYGAPPAGQYGGYPGQALPSTSGKATTVMILGITSLVLLFTCGLGFIPAIISLALVGGARREVAGSGGRLTGSGQISAGKVCSWVTLGLTVLAVVLVVLFGLLGYFAESGGY